HDRRMAAESRRAERAHLHLEDLEKRQAAAEKREAAARLDEQHRQAEKVAAELCEALAAEYEPHARALAAFLARWRDGHRLIDEANAALRQAGRREVVQPPEAQKRTAPARQEADRIVERQEWQISGRRCSQFVADRRTGEMRPIEAGAILVTVRETVPGAFTPARQLPALHSTAVLPAAEIGAPPIWPSA
ncbi:hypothetical protein, partial [Teichococcus aestuarii]